MNPRMIGAVAALALLAGIPASATAATHLGAPVPGQPATATATTDSPLVSAFENTSRSTPWRRTGTLKLGFKTHHPQGIAVTKDRIFLSAVEIIEPTVRYPAPVGGYDRSPGKGVGHLFVLDRQGRLLKDITLGEGHSYHPGGIDFDGESIWVPVAEYRPDSAAIVYRVDAATLAVHREFEARDHIGGLVHDQVTGRLVGNSWGSRRFYEWNAQGRQLDRWLNDSHFVDYQDCQYVADRKALCGGVAGLPQTPTATGSYELGGLALLDLRTRSVLHETPFQQWSTAGHVMTRNPVEVHAEGQHLTLYAAPDDGGEVAGTELFTYEADVTPLR